MAPRRRGWWLAPVVLLVAACGSAPAASPPPTPAATAPSTTAATTSAPATAPATAAPLTTDPPPASTRPATTVPRTTVPPTTIPPTTVPVPPYPIAETTFPLVDTSRPTVSGGHQISATRALTTLVWAPSVAGRWPLVVFAHGFQVGPTPYIGLLQHWASEGYVVAAPEFPLTDQALAGVNLDENDINNQPADVRFVTDWLVGPTSPLAPRIDRSRVAVTGHSDGAETALSASLAPTPAGEPAYRAVIAMSCQPVTTGRSANPPILITQGDADTINPPSYGYATYAQAASPKYLEVLHGAEHLPPEEAGTAWFPALAGVTTAFLNLYVAGDGSAAALDAAGNQSPYGALQAG